MTPPRNYTTDAVVLRNRPLGEKDRIVSLLSQEHGKIPCVAKGARRPGSRLAAATQPFTYARFALARGRNFDVITQVVINDTFNGLHTNLISMACASCATEMIDRALSEHHPEPELFDLLMETLRRLTNDHGEVLLRSFQLRSTALLGYRPELLACVRCGKPRASSNSQKSLFESPNANGARTAFSFHLGGILCEDCRSYDLAAIRIGLGTLETLTALLSAPPERLARLRIADFMRGELVRVIDGWIEHRLEVKLKSKEFLRQVLRGLRDDVAVT